MKTKEEILADHNIFGYMTEYGFAERAMQEYSDQQNAELLSEIEHLKGEQQVLVERINQLTPYKKEGI